MNDSIKRLKEKLIGKEFKEEDYNKELNNLVKEFHLEANTCDFDFDRLYHIGYEEKENWDDEYVCSIQVNYIPVYDENGYHDFDIIKIFDVF